MKILIVHSFYLLPGGEDAVFRQEVELLKRENEVRELAFNNKGGWKGAAQFFASIWNLSAARVIKKEIREFAPDVVHVHNWHFATGPLIIRTAKAEKVPVVLTLHNFRILCPSAILLYKGKVFTDSIASAFPWKAIRYKVYRNSSLLTFWLALIVWVHKKIGTWAMVDRYIVLNEFAKDLFLNSSLRLNADKFVTKPNFVFADSDIKNIRRGNHFLYVGRLSSEKGIDVLLQAFKHTNNILHIAGDGPMKKDVLEICAQYKNIVYIGALSKENVLQAMRECSAFVFPSICFEGMPMTLLEAFATGTTSIVSKLGAMGTMIHDNFDGLFFEPSNPNSLKETVNYWQSLAETQKKLFSENSIKTYITCYTMEKSAEILMKVYSETVIATKSYPPKTTA